MVISALAEKREESLRIRDRSSGTCARRCQYAYAIRRELDLSAYLAHVLVELDQRVYSFNGE